MNQPTDKDRLEEAAPAPGMETTGKKKLPRSSPQTDPTNPYNQESVGEWVRAAQHVDEPGLDEKDLEQRRTSN